MASSVVGCPPVVILAGAAVSTIVRCHEIYDDAVSIMLYGPSDLGVITHTIEVNRNNLAAHGDSGWVTLQDQSSTPVNFAPPGVDKARAYYDLTGAGCWRIKGSGNAAADRVWLMNKIIKMES